MDSQTIAAFLGYIGTALGTITFLPQVIQIYRTKKAKDVSFLTFAINTVSGVLWIAYGLLIGAFPLVLVNLIIGTLSIMIIIMKIKYSKKSATL